MRELAFPPKGASPPNPGSPKKLIASPRRRPPELADVVDFAFCGNDVMLVATNNGEVWEWRVAGGHANGHGDGRVDIHVGDHVSHVRRVLHLPEYAFSCMVVHPARAILGTACGRALLLKKGGKSSTWGLVPSPQPYTSCPLVAALPGAGLNDAVLATADG